MGDETVVVSDSAEAVLILFVYIFNTIKSIKIIYQFILHKQIIIATALYHVLYLALLV